ncbi:hypothetical protein Palpr_1376 [Paludibacter propionicigenes WB4]|uniref:Uncharacterized protein n=1 Tax=Paludibacter propionicigenes (strain DSM 17365 / JCM 13257 / WB4) TaxID=694427 RepID=E4T478_PALPW|nr:hypothetical protein Palpr_1376 [Paludibacter propionicigenes WB4]
MDKDNEEKMKHKGEDTICVNLPQDNTFHPQH